MIPTREEGLFALALEKPAAERDAFLQAVCGDHKAMSQRTRNLKACPPNLPPPPKRR